MSRSRPMVSDAAGRQALPLLHALSVASKLGHGHRTLRHAGCQGSGLAGETLAMEPILTLGKSFGNGVNAARRPCCM